MYLLYFFRILHYHIVIAVRMGFNVLGWIMYTPWTINMEPKNGGLEDYFPFQLGDL